MKNHNFESAYIDESGDNGASGSKFLILTLMCTSQRKKISKLIRLTKQQLLRKNVTARWFNRLGEIKYSNFPDKTLLTNTLDKLAKIDLKIYYIAIEKQNSNIDKEFKNNILTELLRHILKFNNLPNVIIADKQYFGNSKIAYFTAREIKEVKNGGSEKNNGEKEHKFILQTLTPEEYSASGRESCSIEIKIEHENSKLSEQLQALDLISGAIFAKFEHNNSTYWDILQKKNIIIQGNIIHK